MFGLWKTQCKFNELVQKDLEVDRKALELLTEVVRSQNEQIWVLRNEIRQLKQQIFDRELES